ncbi:branched-chain amino acid ABC transporter permease [Archaeoglobus sp.]
MKKALILVLTVIPLVLPLILPKSVLFMLGLAYLFVVYVVTWDLVAGYVGEVNLGHVVFIGLGAYTSTLLVLNQNIPVPISIVIGAIVATLFGLGIGAVCLRLKGYYLALVTAILPLVFVQIVNIYPQVFGGYEGLSVGIKNALHKTIEGRYYVAYLFMIGCVLTLYKVLNSKFGLRLKAIRDDPDLAESLGINVFKYKVTAFCISAFFSGLAGAFTAFYRLSVGVDLFGVPLMLLIIISAVLGGLGTFFGAIIGALTIYILKNWILVEIAYSTGIMGLDNLVIYATLIILILKMPHGIFGVLKRDRI